MSTHNMGFYEEISKIIPLLSSNTHLIASSAIAGLYLCTCTCRFVPYQVRNSKDRLRLFGNKSCLF